MSTIGGPNIVTDGLAFALDAANKKSYPGSGTKWRDLQSLQKNLTAQPSSLTLGTPVRTYPAFSSEIQSPEDSEKAQDGYFSCDITFPSSTPSNSLIFETGASGIGHFIGFKNGLLKVRVGEGGIDTETSLTDAAVGTTSNYPTDGQVHKLTWAWEINPGRIRVFIDNELVIEAFTIGGGQLEGGLMAGGNAANYLSNASAKTSGDPSTAYIPSSASELRYYSGIPQFTQGIGAGYTSDNISTLINSPTFDSGNNGSIVFDGVDGIVQNILNNIVDISNDYTINFYMNPSQLPQLGGIISLGTNSNTDVIEIGIGNIHKTAEANTMFIREYGSSSNRRHIASPNITTGWNFLSFTSDSQSFKSYLNGYLVNSHNVSKPTFNNAVSSPFYIGASRSNTTPQEFFQGNISSVRIYNRALTDTEILQNYNATKSRFGL